MFEYLKEGRCLGPISEETLLALFDAELIAPDTPIREVGELGFRPAQLVVGLLRAAQHVTASVPPPRLERSSRPSAVGGYTVFTSMALPPNPVPRLDRLHCPACGTAIALDATTCGNCDAPLPAPPCPRCGEEIPDGARFCGNCGRSLAP